MVIFKQIEDNHFLLKQHSAAAEQSKCPCLHLQGARIPIYLFDSRSSLEGGAYVGLLCTPEKQSLLDSLLLAQWEDCAWKGLFKYDVTTCQVKVTDGRSKFVVQLNEKWVSNYFPVLKEKGFNNRLIAHKEELLFFVKSGEKPLSELIQSATVPHDANLSIIINVNPTEYGHVFLLPSGFCGLSESLDARLLEMVTRVAVETNNCSFRIFYDFSSSSSNHLCFQACYFANPLPVELVPVVTLSGNWEEKGIHIFEVTDYPIKAVSFSSYGNLKLLVEVVSEICSCLQYQNIRYSLLINDFGTTMFLFPQKTQLDMLENTDSLSALECGGHFVFQMKHDFDQATEEALLKRLAAVSLGEENFLAVKQLCCSVADELCS